MQSDIKRDTFTDLFEKYLEHKQKQQKDTYKEYMKALDKEKFDKYIQDPFAKRPIILDTATDTEELKEQLKEEYDKNFEAWEKDNPNQDASNWFDETIEKLKKEPKLNAQINNQEQPVEDITNKYNNKKSNDLGYRSKYEEDNKQNTSNDISNFNKNKNQNYRYNRDNNNLNQNKYIENNNVNSSKILVGNNVLKDATYISKYENDNNESDSNNKNKNIFVKSLEEQDTKDAIDYINREMPEEYELKSNSEFISVNNLHLVEPKYCDNNGIPVEDNYGTLYSNKKKNNFEDFINNNDIEKKNDNNLSNDNSRNNIVNENVDLLNFTFGKEEEKPSILDKQNEFRETGTFAYDNKNNYQYQYSNPIRNKYNYTPYNSYNYTPYRKRYDNYELPKLNYNYDNISDLMDDNSYKLKLNFDYNKPYQSQGRRYNLHTYRYKPYLRYGY